MAKKAKAKEKIAENIWQRVGGREGGTVAAFGASAGTGAERRIWAGTMAGVFVSDDNGMTWAISNSGLASPYVQYIAVSPNYEKDRSLIAAAAQAVCIMVLRAGTKR